MFEINKHYEIKTISDASIDVVTWYKMHFPLKFTVTVLLYLLFYICISFHLLACLANFTGELSNQTIQRRHLKGAKVFCYRIWLANMK